MRPSILAAALLLLATSASAQPSPSSPDAPYVWAVTAGSSDRGATARMIVGAEWPVSGPLHLGAVQRSTGSFSQSPSGQATPFGRSEAASTYLEVGFSPRASLHLGGGAEVAASAGLAVASLFASWAPFDSGFTAPIEVEATLPIGRRIGVTASASRSLPLISVWSGFERKAEEYSLSNESITIGLRFGL